MFGPAERYSYAGDLRYKPPLATLQDYLQHATASVSTKYVFVQPSAYGRDNACMLDAMREVGPERCRGIVDIDENATDAALERLNAAGVRGVRVNVNPIKPLDAGFSKNLFPRIAKARRALRRAGMDARLPDAGLADA